jgi:MFS family permease
LLNPVAMSIITNAFTGPAERARAIGAWGGGVGLSMALGPVLGGALVGSVGWRSIFWLNVPVAALAVLLTALFVPESRAARPRRPDPLAQVLVMILLATSNFGIIEGPGHGWGSPVIVGCFLVAAAVLAALGWYESRRTEPMLDVRFFRSVPFTGAIAAAICGFAALAGFLLLNALYLQNARGFSPLHAGLLTLPMAALTAVFAPLSGRLVGARGTRVPLVAAGIGLGSCGCCLPSCPLTPRSGC